MNTVFNILTGIFFWAFTIGAVIFGVLGYQVASFTTYQRCVEHKSTFNTPQYKYSYHNNIWYILVKYADPSKFKDVDYLEKKDLEKEYDKKLKTLKKR